MHFFTYISVVINFLYLEIKENLEQNGKNSKRIFNILKVFFLVFFFKKNDSILKIENYILII
jgi:hypothetical protein